MNSVIEFLIGQRVILPAKNGGNEIGVIVSSESGKTNFGVWVFSPSRGHASDYDIKNITPLPRGQL